MTIVSDAGPLIALAKIGAIETLFQIYPRVLTPAAVHAEAVTAGLELGARDAELLASAYDRKQLSLTEPESASLPVAAFNTCSELSSKSRVWSFMPRRRPPARSAGTAPRRAAIAPRTSARG